MFLLLPLPDDWFLLCLGNMIKIKFNTSNIMRNTKPFSKNINIEKCIVGHWHLSFFFAVKYLFSPHGSAPVIARCSITLANYNLGQTGGAS